VLGILKFPIKLFTILEVEFIDIKLVFTQNGWI